MSSGINAIIITGHLGGKPETRSTSAGTPVTNLSVAVTETWTDHGSGEKRERTTWFPVVAFDGTGTSAAQYLDKGSHVLVQGSMRLNEWNDKASGEKRSRMELIADGIKFLDKKSA
jgi:single-strand DNA-binding protein